MNEQNKHPEKKFPRWLKIVNIIALVVILTLTVYIISSDKGSFADHGSGAGDMWWADVPEVEDAYQDLKERRENQ